jgi:DNA (cytosine-5)-methyltransferase 1
MSQLVLSLFPGIGLLDHAFELEGFCVVRGPDLLWGGDIRKFHPPAGRFDGVIGGPPCKRWSRLANIVRAVHGDDSVAEDLIPEFSRCVEEARPEWFLMENVPAAPLPAPRGYIVRDQISNNRWHGGVQNRERRFSFGTAKGTSLRLDWDALEPAKWEPAVCSTAGGRRRSVAMVRGADGKPKPKGNQGRHDSARLRNWTVADMAELQGLPRDFLADAPFTVRGKEEVIGNGVPIRMGRAVARAVKDATTLRWQYGCKHGLPNFIHCPECDSQARNA